MAPQGLRRDATTTVMKLRAPGDFNFWRTVYSHGWCSLPPFACDEEKKELRIAVRLKDGTSVQCRLYDAGADIAARIVPALAGDQRQELAAMLRTCLRFDEDFSPFHAEARRHPEYRWIARSRAGRMLRAPTVFEDAVKMICTTNCTWQLTTLMVSNIVAAAGAGTNGVRIFPDAGTLAMIPEQRLRKEIKAGYRSPFLHELAARVAGGELDIESWRTSTLPTDELFREICSVKGIGPYAAGNLLKLIGRYDYLGLDSWVRSRYYALHRKGRRVKDATIERAYDHLGRWRGLFFWLEMTKEWHGDGTGS